jgi:two-component system, NarL family, response regulator NreC
MRRAPQSARATASLEYSPSGDAEIKVVLADNAREVRRNLRARLTSEDGINVVAEAGDLPTTIRHVKGHAPHVLLLDLRLPGRSSGEAIRRLRGEVPEARIVVLTMDESPVFAQEAIDSGAVGYVLKDKANGELAHAVRCAARGAPYISPRVAACLSALRQAVEIDGLTAREAEVLRLIALGLTSAEISERLELSRRTIDAHRRQIHRKLGLGKRSELVRYAIGHGLIGGYDQAAPQ